MYGTRSGWLLSCITTIDQDALRDSSYDTGARVVEAWSIHSMSCHGVSRHDSGPQRSWVDNRGRSHPLFASAGKGGCPAGDEELKPPRTPQMRPICCDATRQVLHTDVNRIDPFAECRMSVYYKLRSSV